MIDIKGRVDKWECVYKECKAKCCKPARTTVGDLKRISKKLHLQPEEFAEINDGKRGLFRLKSRNGSCYFLHDDYSCELHKRKIVPLSCKMFPFLFNGISYSDDIILKIMPAEGCPGYERGGKVGEVFMSNIEKLGSQFVHEVEQYLSLRQKGLNFEEAFREFRE